MADTWSFRADGRGTPEYGSGEPLVLLHGGVVDARFSPRTSSRSRVAFTSSHPICPATVHTPT